MKRLLIPLALATLAACGPGENANRSAADLSVVAATNALCRPTATGRQVTGCYLTLTASRDDTLLSVESEAAALAQVHESNLENNMMVMYELKAGLPLPAGQAVVLAPGATHIMMLGVREPLLMGDVVPLTLTFANARPVEITATVSQPAVAGSNAEHSRH